MKIKSKKLLFLYTLIIILAADPVHVFAINEPTDPKLGEKTIVDIVWSRTTEPNGYFVLPVAKWNWSDVEAINTDRTSNVWDGGTIGNNYIKDARRNWDIATWSTKFDSWGGSSEVRRFRGEFTIPEGYNVFDDIMLSSVGDYSELELNNIIAINDNIYIFVYPKNQQIDDSNFMEYFAFWTGTASQEAAKVVNNGQPITFHGILGTKPIDYKNALNPIPNQIPKDNLLSHTDGWYCEASEDNVGVIIQNSPDATEFIMDLFIEDYAGDGGMDRLELTFTKTREGLLIESLPGPSPTPEVLPPTEEEPDILPPAEEESDTLPPTKEPDVLPPLEEPEASLHGGKGNSEKERPKKELEKTETPTEESPKTEDANLLPYSFILLAFGACMHYLLRRNYK